MIERMFDSGSMPVLERLVQFTSLRHQQITNNVANINTPRFQPRDLNVEGFRKVLSEAIDARHRRTGGITGELRMKDTRELRFTDNGIDAKAVENNRNIMYHDQGNRSVDEIMKDLAENTLTHNAALEMMRSQFNLLETAIKERI